jgi:hypothetical protein
MSAAFLDRESTIAPPGYNRFLVPPAALAVHLCIGQAYSITMYIMCALLLVGFLCNFTMRPVNEKYHYRAPGAGSDAGEVREIQ